MKNKLFKSIAVVAVFAFLISAMTVTVVAQSSDLIGMDSAGEIGLSEAGEDDPKLMAVEIIKYLMTFLGLIAVCIILYGGFLWMTASGNEDRMDKAKKTIIAGAIGLVVVLAAYAIVTFVVSMTDEMILGG